MSDGSGNYAANTDCTVRANSALSVSALTFETETYFDYILIGANRFSGTSGPLLSHREEAK